MNNPRRSQSSNRAQSATKKMALQSGYTLYNQNGSRFQLPNVKMVPTRPDSVNPLNLQTIQPQKTQQTETQTKVEKKFKTIDVVLQKIIIFFNKKQHPIGNALMMSKGLNYRVAQPYSCTFDFNQKLWEQSVKVTNGLKRVSSAIPQKQQSTYQEPMEEEEQEQQDKYTLETDHFSIVSKPYQFLSQLGGKMLSNDIEQIKEVVEQKLPPRQLRPQTVTTISNVNTIPKRDIQSVQLIQKQSKRPMTSAAPRGGSQQIDQRPIQKERIQSATFDIQEQVERVHVPQERPKSNWSQQRPISAKAVAPEHFFQIYTKYTNFSALDLPYEELFDRNERTVAATFAKFGDLGYYSPIQRIGAYMQYSAKLKKEHLLKIIDLQKTMSHIEKNDNEVPIQLAIIDDLNPFLNRDKTGVNSGADDTYTREPVTLSLYPEYFEDNDEKVSQMELSSRKFSKMLDEMGGYYDPAKLGKQQYVYISEDQWPESIRKQVDTSLQRFQYYIMSDQIKQHEIPKFKKQWIVNACNLLNDQLLENEECSRRITQEIFETFKFSMKRAMIEYILRSPEERKRLHITMIPRQFTHSAQRIAREGGFNIKLFPDWHEYVERGKEFCQTITLISSLTSSLLDWIQDFKNFKLCEVQTVKQIARLGYTFTIPEFSRIQTIYKLNILCLFENVWYRGAMMIIKMGKMLRQKSTKYIWTITGPKLIQNQESRVGFHTVQEESESDEDYDKVIYINDEHIYISQEKALKLYSLRAKSHIFQFKDSCQALSAFMEYLIKIHNPHPQNPIRLSEQQLEQVQLAQDEKYYKNLDKGHKKLLLQNSAVLISLQLRQIVEKSLDYFEQQFTQIPLFKSENIEMEVPEFTSLQGMWALMKDQQFQLPKWNVFKQDFNPVLRIDINIENDQIKFKEDEMNIKTDFSEIYRSIVTCFDKFLLPSKSKVYFDSKEAPYQCQRDIQLNFDVDMGGMNKEDFEKYFKSFWPQYKIGEKREKQRPDLLLASDEQKQIKQEQKYLNVASPTESCFANQEIKLLNHIVDHYKGCQKVIQLFDFFKPFFDKSVEREIKQFLLKKQVNNDEFKQMIEIIQKYLNLIQQYDAQVKFPIFTVNCEPVIKQIKTILMDYKDKIYNKFESLLIDSARAISERYIQIGTYIRKSLKTPEDVEAMEKYVSDVGQERVQIRAKSLEIFLKVVFLLKQDFTLNEILVQLSEELYHKPAQLDKELVEQEEKHAHERKTLENLLKEQRQHFENQVLVYCDDLHNFETFTEKTKYKNYIQEIEDFEQKLSQAEKVMQDIVQKEQTLFGYASQYENFISLQKSIMPYSEMWKNIGLFMENKRKWFGGPICEVDSSQVETIVKNQVKCTSKLLKIFKPNSIPGGVALAFQEDVQATSSNLQTIELLSNPGLRDRHWIEINRILGTQFNRSDATLKELLQNKVDQHLNIMEEISENASKEFSLESALNKMVKEWDNLRLVVINYKNRGCMILQGQSVEDVQQLLDDHTIRAQTIRANPQVKFMEQEAIEWEYSMFLIQEILDLWIKVQGMYLYLEPIFSFEDINKTLPDESEKFQKVQKSWKFIMRAVEEDPIALHLKNIPNLKETLKTSLKLIDEIQKGLENHLEIKRLEFPRFFFLSNDDLINILAETRDPLLVQPHMRKCFEGIEELIFSSNTEILGMKSIEKEEVQFDNRVNPKEYKSNVEKWLLKVEEEMRNTMSHQIRQCFSELLDYPNLQNWVRRWPGQAILTASCMNLTKQVEDNVLKGKTLNRYGQERQQYLNDIVGMVRTSNSVNERQLLSALIVLEVHNNDILQELIDLNIRDISIFQWSSQMRYYLNVETQQVLVKMVYTTINYGYEYLGIGTRLVITPLTDRCYRTLVGALQFNLGGAPEGPAGTGKTESTKDLAKAVAIQCIVFNCGEGLNTHAMAKFFKGLASAGAWSCFDEFNRIDLEVLSVIAQQILQIQQAKTLLKSRFVFQDTEIQLLQSCNIFITMNPGYAGRSELPDNLKALFRPCAMMVPDYAMIAEISLYSFGFVEARALAKKIVAVYKLCSEQLSSQDHYDYGMRAVKAVLTAAQQLKRKQAQEKEDILIYRAICDINLPKFLTQDVMLFNGIMSDLFPDVKPPNVEYKILNEAINQVLQSQRMQIVANFKKKVLQLYEMINCRHGLMIVGQTMSGKTACYQTLAQTLTICNKGGHEELPVQYHILNPKSVTLNQLYGYSDPVSKEWTEGILGEIYRRCATSQLIDRQFIVFDGPVDAGWIENMNTVLDDNKKLCLMSGETIAMSDRMTIMFEVQDLLQASPATVSRCGMVYMQPDQLGWLNIVQKEIQNTQIDQQIQQRIQDLFEALVDKCQRFIKSKCHEYESVPENAFCVHLLKLFLTFLPQQQEVINDQFLIKIDAMFIFCLIWTVGSSVDEVGRKSFDQYLKKLVKDPLKVETRKDLVVKIEKMSTVPELSGTIYDYYYSYKDNRWKSWKDLISNQTIPLDANYQQIMIETVESARITYLLEKSIKSEYPLLLIGPSGVGKTSYVRQYLNKLPFQKYSTIAVNFSATTSNSKMQAQIDAKIDRRRKGIYGPPLGMNGIIFIDDMNMPAPDKYNAQPPLELIRQLLDQKGWYGLDRQFMNIINMNIIGSMNLPGGGRMNISPRLLRHFHLLSIVQPEVPIMNYIFTQIAEWHLMKIFPGIDVETKKIFDYCIEATIDLYQQIREQLKATPRKSWYFLNMRDISRVIQGLTLVVNSKDLMTDNKKIQRLWLHETTRTFYDRLSEEDHEQYKMMLQNSIKSKLRDDFKYIIKPYDDISKFSKLENYIWSDVLSDDLTPTDRQYQEIQSSGRVMAKLQYYLDDLNSNTKKPMNLALFEYAINHILRILRVITMSQGHMLLIGLGGSGRQSLTRLACHIREQEFIQIEVSKAYSNDQWKEDMQKLILLTGADNKEACFVLADSHIKKPFILEDVNNLLNTGDIPNLYSTEEFIPIIDKLRNKAKKEGNQVLLDSGTNAQFYQYFIESAKKKLHVIMAMSPIGETLRSRIRMFPSIVNCTTIDCFHQWPEEALEAVARKFLSEMNLDQIIQRSLVAQGKFMHERQIEQAELYKKIEGRHSYVTPSSYFELLKTFQNLLNTEKTKLDQMRQIYSNGVIKLKQTAEEVEIMEQQLIIQQPLLVQKNLETQQLAILIQGQAEEMEPKRIKGEQEEQDVTRAVQEAEVIKLECEKDLSVAKPKLQQAQDALNTLSANDINSIKAMLKPPKTVQLVMEAVCVLNGIEAMMIPNPSNPKERIPSFWESSKKFLADKDFLKKLISYDKDNISPQIMKRVRDNYISQAEDFNPKRVEKASSAAKGLCEWVLALNEYEKVLTIVRPKMQKYQESTALVDTLQKGLKKTREELNILLSQIQEKQNELTETTNEQQRLVQNIKDCEIKLQRARKLMGGLGGEKERWDQQLQKLESRLKFIQGDILLSSGVIAYLGVFSNEFRQKILRIWLDKMKSNGLNYSENYNFVQILGQPIQIRKWRINGLPSDQFSIENGIIMNRCLKYPLLIDPQGQGNRFIKQNEQFDDKNNPKLKIVKLSDNDFFRILDTSISFGQSLLIENVGEELDSSLDSLLMKQIFKNAGVQSVKVGDNIIQYNKQFNLFFTSKLSNPHYTPDISTKVTLINFTITQSGLEDQLLELCVMREQPNLEEEKNRQILQQHKNQQELQKCEDQILKVLNNADNILNDEEGIEVLQKSKEVSIDIEERQKVSEFTEKKTDEARIQYKPIATHGALLFFSVISLAPLDPMYQYSLNFLLQLYQESFNKAENSQQLRNRINNVNNTMLNLIYNSVCRGLFEKDKLLFSFIILIKLLEQRKQIDISEFQFILKPLVLPAEISDNPFKTWLPNDSWGRLQVLIKTMPKYQQIIDTMITNSLTWMNVINEPDGYQLKFPDPFMQISQMQRLCILKALRPGKLALSIKDYVQQELGDKYIQPPPFSLQLSYQSSNCHLPLLFILPGTDPMNALINFAEQKQIQLKGVSLGQGQGVIAEKKIEEAKQHGSWVILQNCHLAPSWMSKLEKICEDISTQKINSQFRLWLTSYPSEDLPASIIQGTIKMTNEPPNGIKSNITVSFQSALVQSININKKIGKFLYSLCFFHAVLQERRNFGSIGFNIYYDFNQSDLLISVKQLLQISEQNELIPFNTLHYLVGECNYGGRVTDERDRRVIKALLDEYMSLQLLSMENLGGLKEFPIPNSSTYEEFMTSIQNLPTTQPCQLFGFHPNAEITRDLNFSNQFLQKLQITTGYNDASGGDEGKKSETILKQICEEHLQNFPKRFDLEIAQAKYPHDYKNSMNTVFLQEIIRYNKLISVIHSSLLDIEAALKGLVAMSEQIEKVSNSLINGQVPDYWKKYSYPSLKPLGSYLRDFLRRIRHYQNWLEKGTPYVHWISGYFFTQSFLTAVLQNHARKYTIAIDKLEFDFQFLEEPTENYELNQTPRQMPDGTLIFGLYLEGCQWDYQKEQLKESEPRVLYTIAPIIWLKPIMLHEQADDLSSNKYKCPVYKTSERKGVLSTTGHSTNFIMNITMPSEQQQMHWIKRGVAMLCQLQD